MQLSLISLIINIDFGVLGFMSDYFTAEEAAARLGVKPQTLYAYVSRQLIRRIASTDSKRSLYLREDIDKLAQRRQRGSSISKRTSTADRKTAVRGLGGTADSDTGKISSSITQITPGGPIYRGYRFDKLIEHPGRIENVAELLWSGMLLDEPIIWETDPVPENLESVLDALKADHDHLPILRVMGAASITLGESASKELRAGNTVTLARRLVCTYAGCLGMLTPQARFVRPQKRESVAHIAARALGLDITPQTLRGLNALLIACADHELSSATYATRVVASTGAGLHACLLAGIAAHSGHHLGGSCDRSERVFLDHSQEQNPHEKIQAAINEKRKIPGFQSPMYPEGDPRARYLLTLAEQLNSSSAVTDFIALIHEAEQQSGQYPGFEIGLVAIALALSLPSRGASALWAVGRSIGWVAHVMEQRLAGNIIRPRARYASR